ncbi:MAG: barstar family protein [bacterium]
MTTPHEVIIDLKACENKQTVLLAFGEAFQFGGPNGNFPCKRGIEGGWGVNWDALADSLTCLEEGGIWGTSPKFEMPLRVIIKNGDAYQRNDPEGFETLMEILSGTQFYYSGLEWVFC